MVSETGDVGGAAGDLGCDQCLLSGGPPFPELSSRGRLRRAIGEPDLRKGASRRGVLAMRRSPAIRAVIAVCLAGSLWIPGVRVAAADRPQHAHHGCQRDLRDQRRYPTTPASNAIDGDVSTYWHGLGNYSQLRLDFGADYRGSRRGGPRCAYAPQLRRVECDRLYGRRLGRCGHDVRRVSDHLPGTGAPPGSVWDVDPGAPAARRFDVILNSGQGWAHDSGVYEIRFYGVPAFQYEFTGFFQPVDNGALNVAKAGSAIPVKFSLGGDQGLDIFAASSPTAVPIGCDTGKPVDAIETTTTSSHSGLTYDAASDQYTYVWKTDKAWSGTCRQLQVMLGDGSLHTADFQFK